MTLDVILESVVTKIVFLETGHGSVLTPLLKGRLGKRSKSVFKLVLTVTNLVVLSVFQLQTTRHSHSPYLSCQRVPWVTGSTPYFLQNNLANMDPAGTQNWCVHVGGHPLKNESQNNLCHSPNFPAVSPTLYSTLFVLQFKF